MTIREDSRTGYEYAEVISKKLEADIESQELKDGEKLMTVRQLAAKYETSYPTMRKAINLLADRGILSCRQGSGVYVARKGQSTFQEAFRQKLAVIYCGFEEYVAAGRIYTDLQVGIEEEAVRQNAEVTVLLLQDPQEFIKRDAYSESDGFLIVGEDIPGLRQALEGRPVVWMMGGRKGWGDHISYDNRLVGVFCAEELVAAGRKNLACINVEEGTGDERCRAFKEHAESMEAEVLYWNNPEALIRTRHEQHINFDALSDWVDRIEEKLPDLNGVFVVDLVAYPLYNMLKERGITPGKDIEIATSNWCDYIVGGAQYQPVNILLHPEEVGSVAVQQLCWRIQNPEARRRVLRIEPEVEKPTRSV